MAEGEDEGRGGAPERRCVGEERLKGGRLRKGAAASHRSTLVEAERGDVAEAQVLRDLSGVAVGLVAVEGQVRGVEGAAMVHQAADLSPERASQAAWGRRPEETVMNYKQVDAPLYRRVDHAFTGIDGDPDVVDGFISGIDLQPVLARIGVGGRRKDFVEEGGDGGQGGLAHISSSSLAGAFRVVADDAPPARGELLMDSIAETALEEFGE